MAFECTGQRQCLTMFGSIMKKKDIRVNLSKVIGNGIGFCSIWLLLSSDAFETYLGVLVKRTIGSGLKLDSVEFKGVEDATNVIKVACLGK